MTRPALLTAVKPQARITIHNGGPRGQARALIITSQLKNAGMSSTDCAGWNHRNHTVHYSIRVLLSEDVLQRMRDPAQGPGYQAAPTAVGDSGTRSAPTATEMQEDLRRRYERERALVQEELERIARREQEAGQEKESAAVLRERARARQDAEKAQQLAKELEKKEAELKGLAAFYKEQLAALEKKNLDYYQMTLEQYQEAANKAEAHIKPRNTMPVCSGLQAQILDCYRENHNRTLSCSSLAKEYMLCVSAARKDLLANRA